MGKVVDTTFSRTCAYNIFTFFFFFLNFSHIHKQVLAAEREERRKARRQEVMNAITAFNATTTLDTG